MRCGRDDDEERRDAVTAARARRSIALNAELRSPQGRPSPHMWEAFQQVAHRLDSGHRGAQVVVIDRPTAP